MVCDGYVTLANEYISRYGYDKSNSQREGMTAHSLAEDTLNTLPRCDVPLEFDGAIMSADMRIKVRDYVQFCDSLGVGLKGFDTWVEYEFESSFLEKGLMTRIDYALYDPNTAHLNVVDLKYGHREIGAQNNYQLLIGAQSMIDHMAQEGKEVASVSMFIYQPNGPSSSAPVKEWRCEAADVRYRSEYVRSRYITKSNDLTPGHHCRNCEARGICTAVEAALYEAWDVMGNCDHVPSDLSADQMEKMLAECAMLKDLLRAWETGLEAMVISQLKAGIEFTKWEYSTSLTDRKWAFPERDIIALGRSMGVELEKKSILSPKQAEMAGMSKEVVDTLVERQSTGLKLRGKSLKTLKQAFG